MHVPTTHRALRPHARAGDALPEGRPGLGRADRFGPRPGQELAADGLRLARALGGPRRRSRLAIGARHHRPLGGAGRQARPGAGGRARRPPTISRAIRRSPTISRASSRIVRALPADPIIVRQNWLRAYDFTTDRGARGAQRLRAHQRSLRQARQACRSPIDVSSVIRASPLELPRRLDRAPLRERRARRRPKRWTAILTIVDPDAARRRRAPEEPARRLRQRHQLVEGAGTMTRRFPWKPAVRLRVFSFSRAGRTDCAFP